MKRIGVSPITNTIFYGNINSKGTQWTGKKEDITDMAIVGVFEWFKNQMEGKDAFEIRYPDVEGYVLKMERE